MFCEGGVELLRGVSTVVGGGTRRLVVTGGTGVAEDKGIVSRCAKVQEVKQKSFVDQWDVARCPSSRWKKNTKNIGFWGWWTGQLYSRVVGVGGRFEEIFVIIRGKLDLVAP